MHLARGQPQRAAAALLLCATAAASSVPVFHSALAPLGTLLLLAGALAEFLFPVVYRLTPEGAEARGFLFWRRIAWEEVKRVRTGEQEIKLSPLPFDGPREPFRGVVLRCPANREEVLSFIRVHSRLRSV